MRHVLVTGGAGFIGSHLVERLLADGYAVTVLDDLSTGSRANVPADAELLLGDVTDANAVEAAFARRPDAVCHVAGQASIVNSFMAPERDLEVNLRGTVNVVGACLRHRVERLLYASSMTVYGQPTIVPTPESEPCRPISYYGISKYAAERFVHVTAARPDLGFDFRATSFRMFNVYGERQSIDNPYQGVLAIFVGNALRDEPITIHGDGKQSRDFVYIDDVAAAWLAALKQPTLQADILNLGAGVGRSIRELAEATLRAVGRPCDTHTLRSGATRPGDQRLVAADVSQAYRALGWRPRVSFEDGLRRVIAWAAEQDSVAGSRRP